MRRAHGEQRGQGGRVVLSSETESFAAFAPAEATIHRSLPAMTDEDPDEANAPLGFRKTQGTPNKGTLPLRSACAGPWVQLRKFVETAEVRSTGGPTAAPENPLRDLLPCCLACRRTASSARSRATSIENEHSSPRCRAKEPLFFLCAVAWGTSQTAQYSCRLAQPPYEMESLSRGPAA